MGQIAVTEEGSRAGGQMGKGVRVDTGKSFGV